MKGSSLWRTVRLGVSSLMLHKLRSALTTMGVLFGTSSVIGMLAIGEGASAEAQEQIRQLGSNNIILRSVKPREDFATGSGQTTRVVSYGVTEDDLARVAFFERFLLGVGGSVLDQPPPPEVELELIR